MGNAITRRAVHGDCSGTMYTVELAERVQRFLNKLDATIKTRIEKRLKRLEDDPVPSDAKCIGRRSGENVFRYRIGGFRVLYTVNASARAVLVHKLGKRPRVYSR